MGHFRLLEHTADMGIEAFGETRQALFAAAAEGLMAIIGGTERARPTQERGLTVSGGDPAELLVNWLGEVLYLVEQGFVPVRFTIRRIGDTDLEARVAGETYDAERHAFDREVKAITYHQLRLEEADGRWQARVFVDL